MSHFYADIQGNRGMATRQGTKKSGIRGHIRGWDLGIKVFGYINGDGEDCFDVHLTSGSNGHKPEQYMGTFKAKHLLKS